MKIQINPRSLLNLLNISEVLYKLHPYVLDYLVEMERSLGGILGAIDLDNPSLEEGNFLANIFTEEDFSKEPEEPEEPEDLMNNKEHENSCRFHELRKYIQLDTDEYIPMKISVEVEDPVIGRKVKNWLKHLKRLERQNSFI